MVLPEAKKEKIVLSVLEGKISVSKASKDNSIARKTIYTWIKRYKKGSLAPLYIKGNKHPKAVYPKAYSYINRWVVAHPDWGCRVLSSKLKSKGINLSHVQINRMLNRMGAESFDRRLNYARNFSGPGRNSEDVRIEIVKKAIIEKASISSLSEDYKVARKTIYRWIKKYEAEGAIKDAYVTGEVHPKAIYPKIAQQVLGMVVANPEYSVHTLKKFFPASSWTIWKILDRNNLNTRNLRLEYSRNASFIPEQKISTTGIFGKVRSVFESFTPNLAPAPPPKTTSILKTFAISSFFSFITIYGFLSWISIISGGDSFGSGIGLVFAGVALSFGMFFFLYSLKYFISTAIVLSHSQKEGLPGSKEGAIGLRGDLDKIRLERCPFVSVHLALYNEKNVVERLAKAVTSFDYDNYEVIFADDSNDETSDLIRAYQKTFLLKGESFKQTKGDGWVMTEVEVKNGVTFKHIHRTARTGYKGAALGLALKLTNPKAEFVSVYDADFVPYPDSLTLFLKYFKLQNNESEDYLKCTTASVQGYQWHVLNKSENWITRGIRSEYAGSYVIERAGTEIYGGLKQISGSVYMIRKSVLEEIGWGTSITEDFELTLKLYEKGYKVVYTPYIQAPAECVSTLRRLIRQRMRWAEGHSFNIKRMFMKLMLSPKLSQAEKFETIYLAPYYLQATFFLVGTMCWLIAETIFKVRLPFWTELWGWSLILTNMISLPLLNSVGLFLEESEQKDYSGIPSFIALSYLVVPFQAYAAVKGFLEKEEGPWFRTPKTGRITDVFKRGKFYKFISRILPGKAGAASFSNVLSPYLALSSANNRFDKFRVVSGKKHWVGNLLLSIVVCFSILLPGLAPLIPVNQSVMASDFQVKKVGSKEDNLSPQKQKSESSEDEIWKSAVSEEVTTPRIVSKTTGDGEAIEYIFHQDPRVRIKYNGQEIEIKTLELNGRKVIPEKALIFEDKEVLYREIAKDVDLRYTLENNTLKEEFIIKTPEAVSFLNKEITQQIQTVGIKVVSVDSSNFGFYTVDGEELFKFSEAYAKDANGNSTYEIGMTLEKGITGYTLRKNISPTAGNWLEDTGREFPIIIDPTVVVSGNIVETDAQFGGLQRKLAYANGNWYVFYSDLGSTGAGGDVWYKKSSDGATWGSAVDMDSSDVDNYNPAVWLEGDYIYVTWMDDGTDMYEVNRINTADNDGLGTKRSSADQGSITTTYMASIAVADDGTVYVAGSDTSTDTEMVIFKLVYATGTWTTITAGSGLTSSDRPVLLTTDNNLHVVFQGGGLYHSIYDGTKWVSSPNTENEVQFGGLQRKLVYANSNWYAFYINSGNSSEGIDVYYRKSADGSTWGSRVEMDTADDDNYNPSIWLEGDYIYVVWIDNSGDSIEVNTVNTASSDALGTKCSSADQGSLDITTSNSYLTHMASIAVADNGTVYFAYSDTSTDTEAKVYKLAYSGCTFTDITTGSGLTASDRPVLATTANNLHMIFQSTPISHAIYDGSSWTAVGGGVSEAESSLGGQQRKVVYANSNWYAFYTDTADIWYKKSSNGTTWGTAVDLDTSDADNYNPSIWLEGDYIYVTWIDDGTDTVEVNTINTASSDTLGTKCTAADQGGITGANYMASIAVADNGTVYVAFSDTSTDTEVNLFSLAFSGCTFTDIRDGSTLTSSDRPVIVTMGNDLHMIYQDGNLSHSIYSSGAWTTAGGDLTETEAQFGGLQRKVVYANGNWYAFYVNADPQTGVGTNVIYRKSSNGTTWSSANIIDSTDADNYNITVWLEGDYIYVAWLDDSADGLEVNTINTASSDALGTKCTTIDQGSLDSTNTASVAVADDGTVYLAYSDYSTDTEVSVFKLVYSGCTFTPIITGSSLTASDRPVLTTIGNDLHMIFQDGNLSHSVYNGSSWDSANTTIAAVTNNIYSVTDDGTNLWLLTVNSTTGTNFYKYDGSSWGSQTAPWTSQTNVTSVSLTYDSTNTDLYAHIIKDTSEQAYFMSTDTSSISWGSETSYGFIAGDLGHISGTMHAAGSSQVGIVIRRTSNFKFSNVTPTNSNILDYTGLIDSVTSNIYSVATDGTSLWILAVSGTTATTFYKCVSCATTDPDWVTETAPWTGQTNVTSVSLTYDSTNTDLYAHIIKDTSEQAYYKSTDSTTISWGSETSYGFTAGDLGHISSPMTAAGTSLIGAVLRQGLQYRLSDLTPTQSTIIGGYGLANADDPALVYSLTTDGTNLWLISVFSTAIARFYSCASCSTTTPTWTLETSPWTGLTNLTSATVTYDSTNTDLYAMIIMANSEQAYFKSSDSSTISWGSQSSFGFTAGNLGHISSPMTAAGTSQIGIILRQNANIEFGSISPSTSVVAPGDLIGAVADTYFSVTTDNTSLWVLSVSGTTSTNFYTCSSCTSAQPTWSSLTAPWTGQTNVTSVSLTYDSINTDLYAHIIKDTSEQAYYKSTDLTTISWGDEVSLEFTAGDLGYISSPMTAAGSSQLGAVLRQGTNFEFATVPENILALLLLVPVFSTLLQKYKKRRNK